MSSIYTVLNQLISDNIYRLSPSLFNDSYKYELYEEDQSIFDLLKNISAIRVDAKNNGFRFVTMFEFTDGRRTFKVEDLTENDYKTLQNLDLYKIPLILRTLICEILWDIKKDYMAAKIGAEAYWKLFYERFGKDRLYLFDFMCRAMCISKQIHLDSLYSEIKLWLNNFAQSEDIKNDVFLTLQLFGLFLEQKDFDNRVLLSALDTLINDNFKDIIKCEQAFNLKTKSLYKLGDKEGARKNNILLADYYLKYADSLSDEKFNDIYIAVDCYERAIKLYRNNGETTKSNCTFKRMTEIQKKLKQSMSTQTITFDMQNAIKLVNDSMEGLTFAESIVRLTQLIMFEKIEDVKKRVLDEKNAHPLQSMISNDFINDSGQTKFILPALDIHNPEKDENLLRLHLFQNAFKMQNLIGNTVIRYALEYIKKHFSFDKSSVEFLVKKNPIIPDGRESIFQTGIFLFLSGDYYSAMHILAPQIENLFRYLANVCGGITTTLENDGSSNEKVLRSIFNDPELLECYDKDILFTFQGLLNEKAGANIRNEVAHGIIDENISFSGTCLYFGVATIKLLSFSSRQFIEIFKNSTKLQSAVGI